MEERVESDLHHRGHDGAGGQGLVVIRSRGLALGVLGAVLAHAASHGEVGGVLDGGVAYGDGVDPHRGQDAVGAADHGLLGGDQRVEWGQRELGEEVGRGGRGHSEYGDGLVIDVVRVAPRLDHGGLGRGLHDPVDR